MDAFRLFDLVIVFGVGFGYADSDAANNTSASRSVMSRSEPARQAGGSFGSSSRMPRNELSGSDGGVILPPLPMASAPGLATGVDRRTRTFMLTGEKGRVAVRWSSSTDFSGIGADALNGSQVLVQGHMAEGVMHATSIAQPGR